MKISIIILSFNNYEETTGKCLHVLAEDPDFEKWDVIVVDNASEQITRKKLNEARLQFPHVRFILNEQNVGFSAGNNIGIKQSMGEVIILLNSDAFPSPGMMRKLAEHFNHDAGLGMIGPVTNAAGNEQCIYTNTRNYEEIREEGLRYALSGGREILSAYRLDFFCVAIPKIIFEKVGHLDEEFGRGYYEDFDYSLRVKEAGFKLGVAEDVFVYHRGSTSFGKMPNESKTLLKKNKKLILKNHGSSVLFPHLREANLSILSQYSAAKDNGLSMPNQRIMNRLQKAKNELPKSWLKRLRYLRSLRKIETKLLNTSDNVFLNQANFQSSRDAT